MMSSLRVLLPALLLGCAAPAPSASQSDVADLHARIETATVLDVRTPSEFASGHISGARNIPVQELPARLSELESLVDREIDVICLSGGRSKTATNILQENGFKARNIRGGMRAWQAAAYPTVTP